MGALMNDIFAKAKAERRQLPDGLLFDYFYALDGCRLRYGMWPLDKGVNPRGTIIFIPGRTEFAEKFIEDMRVMNQLGFATAALDLRGQGLSDRPYGDINKHDLDSFDPHVTDLRQVIGILRDNKMPEPFILMAHSAGSHVSLRFLHDYGEQVAGAITVAPMTRIDTGGIPMFIARLLPKIMNCLWLEGMNIPGHKAFREGKWGWRKLLTHDDERFGDEDYFVTNVNQRLAVGGATYRWFAAALASTDILMAPGYAETIKRPVLLFRAEEDKIIRGDATDDFAKRLPNARYVTLKGAMHEVLKETDDIRARAYEEILPFLDEIAPLKSKESAG